MLARDRVRREIRPPSKYAHTDIIAYALNIGDTIELDEPVTFTEVSKSKDKANWLKAIKEEMDSLLKNKTRTIVKRPQDQRVISCKWIYKRKPGIPGVEATRFKAWVIAKGYSQLEGIDYHEVFSPMVKNTSIRLILAMVALDDLELEQLNVKTIFLHGNLEERIYMEQPMGFMKNGTENLVCLLKKSLYGLKKSPRQWYKRFDDFILSISYHRCNYDHCVYSRKVREGIFIYLLIYVNDMLVACKDKTEIQSLKVILKTEFDMKDLGAAKRILGINIIRDIRRETLRLS